MLLARQSHEVSWSVIVLDSVQVVNMPTIWQRLAIRLFPSPNVFRHIAIFMCSRMFRFQNINIPCIILMLTTLPTRMLFSRQKYMRLINTTPPSIFKTTTHTPVPLFRYDPTTIKASVKGFSSLLSHKYISTAMASNRIDVDNFPTIKARMLALLIIMSSTLQHYFMVSIVVFSCDCFSVRHCSCIYCSSLSIRSQV